MSELYKVALYRLLPNLTLPDHIPNDLILVLLHANPQLYAHVCTKLHCSLAVMSIPQAWANADWQGETSWCLSRLSLPELLLRSMEAQEFALPHISLKNTKVLTVVV